MKHTATAAALGLAALLAAGAAAATPTPYVTVSGSGIWAAGTPTTSYSVAGESFSFSFDVPLVFPTIFNDGDTLVTTDFTNYSYDLNGSPVAGTPDNIGFFSAAEYGGFALSYGPTAPGGQDSVELVGPVVARSLDPTDGTVILQKSDVFYPNMNDVGPDNAPPTNQGFGPTAVSVVPEPATWTLAFLGFGAVGALARGRRRAAPLAA